MKFTNSEISPLCINLLAQRKEGDKVILIGLLAESITLGMKRRLEKIRLEALKHLEQYNKDLQVIDEEMDKKLKALLPEGSDPMIYFKAKEGTEEYKVFKVAFDNIQKLREKEVAELDAEEVEINCEQVSMAMIEKIETSANYDWGLIEKIAV